MLGLPGRVPKTVTVRVQRASGLVNPHIDGKKKPKALKWRVAVKSGKKKLESDSVVDAAGNPSWDFEVTLKIAKIDEPVAIKVTDSDGHHIGQVIIPLVKIPPRPADPSKRPASPSRLCAAELEPTRKVSHVTGTLYYWVWAEDFYDDDGPPKSSRSSALGSVHLHRSASRLSGIVHHKSKHGADAASVQGSTISMYSKTGDKSDKPWYKKHTGKHIREALHRSHKTDSRNGSEISYTMSQSMGSLFPDAVARKDNPSSYLGHDGSVLGASSIVSGSDLYGGESSHLSSGGRPVTVQNPLPAVPSPDMTPALSRAGSQRKIIQPSAEVSRPAEIKKPDRSPSSLLSKAQNRKSSSSSSVSANKTAINESPQPTPPAAPPRSSEASARREPVSILKPPKEVSDSDLSSNSESDADELSSRPPQKTSSPSVTANAAPLSNTPPEPDPVLLSLTPASGPAEGDFEIFVFASGLTDSVMKSALLLIDGYTIATNRWKVEVGHWAEAPVGTTHRLTVRLPPMPVGRVYLELETMFKGRLRCPQPFTFEATSQSPSTSPPIPLFPAKKPSAVVSPSAKPGPPAEENSPISGSTGPSSSPGHTSLVRTGSQRDSIRLTDKRQRSFRAGRPSDEQPSVTVSSTADVMYSGSARTRSSGFGSEDSASELGTVRTVDPNASVAGSPTRFVSPIVRVDSRRRMTRPEAIPEEPTSLTTESPVKDVNSIPEVGQSTPRSTPTRFNQDFVRVDSRRRMMRPEPIPEEPASSVPTSPVDSSQKPMKDIKATEAMTEAPLGSSPSKLLPASLTMQNEDKLAQPQVDETGPKVSDFVLESASSQQSRTAVDTLPNPTVTAPSVPDTTVLPAVISVPGAVVASSLPSTSQDKEEARSQSSDVEDGVKPNVPAEDSKVLSTTNSGAPISTDAAQTQSLGSPHGVRNQRSLEEEFKLAETNCSPSVATAASDVGFKDGAECSRSSTFGSAADQGAPLQALGEPKSLQNTQQAKDDHRDGQQEEKSESSKEEAVKDEHTEDNDKDGDDDDDGGEVKSKSQVSSDSNSEHSPVGLSQQGAPTLPHSGIEKAHLEEEEEEEEDEEEDEEDEDEDEGEEDGEDEDEDEDEEEEEEEEHHNIEGPQLLAITPTSGPTTGNLMVKVFGRGLEESVMRHAVILVDDCTLRDSDWSLASVGEAGGTPQGATHCLTIHLPTPLTAGRVFIELETVAHGRLRCPQAFIAVADRPSYSARGTGQVANLLKAVEEANKQIAQMRMTVSALESDVAAKCSEEARISGELYRLRMRLLEDGGLKYLERQ